MVWAFLLLRKAAKKEKLLGDKVIEIGFCYFWAVAVLVVKMVSSMSRLVFKKVEIVRVVIKFIIVDVVYKLYPCKVTLNDAFNDEPTSLDISAFSDKWMMRSSKKQISTNKAFATFPVVTFIAYSFFSVIAKLSFEFFSMFFPVKRVIFTGSPFTNFLSMFRGKLSSFFTFTVAIVRAVFRVKRRIGTKRFITRFTSIFRHIGIIRINLSPVN